MGLPGLAGADHIGITVPDLEAATRFFVDVIGCKVTFEVGPFASDDDWMQQHLGVDPRSKINKLRMLKCANGPSIELFEYEVKDQKKAVPKNSDVGGHHVGFYVTDLDAAVAHLRRNGVKVLGEPTLMNDERRTVGRAAVGVFRLAVGNDDGAHVLSQRSPNHFPSGTLAARGRASPAKWREGMAYEAGTKDILWRPAEA